MNAERDRGEKKLGYWKNQIKTRLYSKNKKEVTAEIHQEKENKEFTEQVCLFNLLSFDYFFIGKKKGFIY